MLNRALFLGLRSFEAQLAFTPTGGFYKRHLDSFAGARNRIVSLVAYLDADWHPEDGGICASGRPTVRRSRHRTPRGHARSVALRGRAA